MISEKFATALDFFKTKSPSLIGVDIASTSLKLVELSETGKGTYRLERYAIEPLPKPITPTRCFAASGIAAQAWPSGPDRVKYASGSCCRAGARLSMP